MPPEDTPEVEVRSRADLRAWLEANHASSGPVWIVVYKKHHEHYVSWDDLVSELLCFGWIDSLKHRVDEDRSRQYVSPRKPGSNWSGINKRKVAALGRAGLMTEAGRAVIVRAKRDGSWAFLDDIEALVVPPDLEARLAEDAEAAANFEAFPRSAKMAFLYWLKSAKAEGTRAKRLDETLRAARQNVRIPGRTA